MGYDPAGSASNATQLQGRQISGASPSNGDELTWDSALSVWKPEPESGGGGGTFTGLDFTGSNLTSILTRNFSDLQGIPAVANPSRQTFSNASVAVSVGTTTLAQIGTMSATRTVTLPPASSYTNGTGFILVDESGTLTSLKYFSVVRAGSDTVNGGTAAIIVIEPIARFLSDGTSKWFVSTDGDRFVSATGQAHFKSLNINGNSSTAEPFGVFDLFGTDGTSGATWDFANGNNTDNNFHIKGINGYPAFAANGRGQITLVDDDDVAGDAHEIILSSPVVTAQRTIAWPDANGSFALTANSTGVSDIAHGGTNATTAAGARTNLGANTVGANLFTATNPSAISFPKIAADNSVSFRTPSQVLSDIGAGTGNGSVTSIATTSPISGGTITGTGTISLLTNVDFALAAAQTVTLSTSGVVYPLIASSSDSGVTTRQSIAIRQNNNSASHQLELGIASSNFSGTLLGQSLVTGASTPYINSGTNSIVVAVGGTSVCQILGGANPGIHIGTGSTGPQAASSLTLDGTRIDGMSGSGLTVNAYNGALVLGSNNTTALTLDTSQGITFTKSFKSTTALATPSALSATQWTGFASTVSGAAIMGYGTTNDVSLMNRAGTVVLGVGPNTTVVNIPGSLSVTGTVAEGATTVTEPVGSSALTLTGATQTTSQPVINATQTWNASGTTFDVFKINVTNTASASASSLMRLQVGGTDEIYLDKSGNLNTQQVNTNADFWVYANGGALNNLTISNRNMGFGNDALGAMIAANQMFVWQSANYGSSTGTKDTGVSRISAGLTGVGTGAQGSFAGRQKLTSQIYAGTTIATLNASPTTGEVASVTDGDSGLAWGATAVNSGGGTTKYLVWYNGANWTIVGK